jgi:AcrR family transcriptional regulator
MSHSDQIVPGASAAYQRTHEAILDAATRVLSEHGAGASMQDVAAEAGVGRATLYRHARSREELVAALQLRAIDRLVERLGDARLGEQEPRDALERVVHVLIGLASEFRFISSEAMHLDKQEVFARVGPSIDAMLEQCRGAGILRDDQPLAWQGRILGAMCMAALEHSADDPGADPRRLALDAFLDGQGAARKP